MQIIEATAFGGPDVLVPREVPDPVPGPGEVVLRVAAADTLFALAEAAAGGLVPVIGTTFPLAEAADAHAALEARTVVGKILLVP